ncbi:MAG TPA: hypothetical protein VJ697_04730, partial [Nitrososphaeraceae archaeon]|nr:hypothetical protein [Nitrososphaeraceae archaeon]
RYFNIIAEVSKTSLMKYPIKNIVYEKVKQSNTLTDSELSSLLNKDGIDLDISELNKILLDLEIYGLLKVSWIAKDKRRIELVK